MRTFFLALGCSICLVMSIDVAAKEWRGIVPLHSTRADVKRLLGKPLFEEGTPIDIYDVTEGRINFTYINKKCQQGLPSNWGNWNVPPDTVAKIVIHLKKPVRLADLAIPNIEKLKWYTDDSVATYYHDKTSGVEYEVTEGMVNSMTYGPMERDDVLLCIKNAPLIRY